MTELAVATAATEFGTIEPAVADIAAGRGGAGGVGPAREQAGVLCELVNDDGTMMRVPELTVFAKEHGLTLVSIADLIAYRRRTERQVERVTEARLPTEFGLFTAYGYRSNVDGAEQIALVCGDLGDGRDVLVRVHSECLTGDV